MRTTKEMIPALKKEVRQGTLSWKYVVDIVEDLDAAFDRIAFLEGEKANAMAVIDLMGTPLLESVEAKVAEARREERDRISKEVIDRYVYCEYRHQARAVLNQLALVQEGEQ